MSTPPKKKAKTTGNADFTMQVDLVTAAEKFVKSGSVISYSEANALWTMALDGPGVTTNEFKTLEHILATYKFTDKGRRFLEELATKKISGKSQYQMIDTVKYDRSCLDLALHLAKDGKLDLADAKLLWADVEDGPGVTATERKSIRYAMCKYTLTAGAQEYFDKRLGSKLCVGVLGATGMVGQRFVALLNNHPDFKITVVAASANSAGKLYSDVMKSRWVMTTPLPDEVGSMTVLDASKVSEICSQCDFVFCAVDLDKKAVLKLEEEYARAETPVVSNNSAARPLADVPMIIPEVNHAHTEVIAAQRLRLGTKYGFIAVKPNCSIQSYVPALAPLKDDFGLKSLCVCTYQAISGAGKTFETWPEIVDNVIPYIGGEEPKSEVEPMKIWGKVEDGKIVNATAPLITTQCMRVPVTDGHMSAVYVTFDKKPTIDEIKSRWANWSTEAQKLKLASAPTPFLTYFEENDRPQSRLDRDVGGGMGVSIGRLREDALFDYKFVCLAHNTVRGAAGGAVLVAELLHKQGHITTKSSR